MLSSESSQLSDIKVRLEDFYGPIDLLLQLTKENEIDVTELTISKIIDQYITLLKGLKNLNIDVAVEFIYFASQLLVIKARFVVPFHTDESEEEEQTPKEFIRKLLEYKKFKVCMEWVESRHIETSMRCTGPGYIHLEGEEEVELENVSLFNIVAHYARLKHSIELRKPMQVVYSDIPIELYISGIIKSLKATGKIILSDYFKPLTIQETVGNLLAMLELIKLEQVELDLKEKPLLKFKDVSGVGSQTT